MQLLNWKCHFCSMPEFLHPGGSWGSAGAFPWIFFLRVCPLCQAAFPIPNSLPHLPSFSFLSRAAQWERCKNQISWRFLSNRNPSDPLNIFLPFVGAAVRVSRADLFLCSWKFPGLWVISAVKQHFVIFSIFSA